MHPPGARAMADATAHSLDPGTLEEKGGSSLGGGRRGSVNNTNNDLSQPFMVASSVMVPSVDSRRAPAAAAAASPAAEPRRCFMPGENPAGDPSKIGECDSIVGCFLNLAAPGAGTFCLSCIGGSWRGVRYGLATLLLFAALFVFPFSFLWAIIAGNIGSPPVLLYVYVICSLALAFLVYLYNLVWTYKTAAAAAASPAAEPRRCFMPGENPAGDPSKIGECASIVGCFLNLAAPGAGTFCLSCIGGSWRGVRYGLATLLLFAALFVFPFRFLWAIITNNIGSPPVLLYVWVICSLALAFLVYLYNLAWTYKTATSPTFSLWSIPRLTRGEAWVCGCLNILPIPGAGACVAGLIAGDGGCLAAGILQFMMTIGLFGWIWAIVWAYKMVKRSGPAYPPPAPDSEAAMTDDRAGYSTEHRKQWERERVYSYTPQ